MKVTLAPVKGTVVGLAVLVMLMSGRTSTTAVSESVTLAPAGGVPATFAVFVNSVCTLVLVQVSVDEAPGASVPMLQSQFVASGSVTVTLVSVTLPVLVT